MVTFYALLLEIVSAQLIVFFKNEVWLGESGTWAGWVILIRAKEEIFRLPTFQSFGLNKPKPVASFVSLLT